MRYELVIFDFDGTLADTFPWFLGILGELADRHNFRRVGPDEIEALRGVSTRELIRRLGVPLLKIPAIAGDIRRIAGRDAGQFKLFAGVDGLLRGLRSQGVLCAIVSSNTEAAVRQVLGPELRSLISHYACGASLFGKPGLLKKTLKLLGQPAHRALYVGDEGRDGEAAAKAKMDFGFASWGYAREEALQGRRPSLVFASIREILEKVAS